MPSLRFLNRKNSSTTSSAPTVASGTQNTPDLSIERSAAAQAVRLAIENKALPVDNSRQNTISNYLNTMLNHQPGSEPTPSVVYSRPTKCELRWWREVSASSSALSHLEQPLFAVKQHAYTDWTDWMVSSGHEQGTRRCWCSVTKPKLVIPETKVAGSEASRGESDSGDAKLWRPDESAQAKSLIARLESARDGCYDSGARSLASSLLAELRDSPGSHRKLKSEWELYGDQLSQAPSTTSVRHFAFVPSSSSE